MLQPDQRESQGLGLRTGSSVIREEDEAATEAPLGTAGTRQVFEVGCLTLQSVCVHSDRAEVRRLLRPRLPQGGETELVIRSLSAAIQPDSVRVEVVRGAATIADVTFLAKPDAAAAAAQKARVSAAQDSLAEERRRLESLRCRLARLCKQRDVLNSFADMLIGHRHWPSSLAEAFNPAHMQTLSRFFDLYGSQASRLDDQVAETRLQIQLSEAATSELEEQLAILQRRFTEQLSREISVLLESQEAGEVELRVCYVVGCCQWEPDYDVRVFSNDSAMKIIYYGLVKQSTGERWENCQLLLSTSQPGVGGAAPATGVHSARFKGGRAGPKSSTASVVLRRSAGRLKGARHAKALSFHADGLNGSQPQETASQSTDRTEVPQSRLSWESRTALCSHQPAAQFSVPRPASIPSDGLHHRVAVAIIDLRPTFEYESVPQKSPFAFLKATAVNASGLALLPGQANVYLDNGFVAKTWLTGAAPQEQLSCQLGSDRRIKISYRPMVKRRLAGPGRTARYLYKQVIELCNTHQKPVRVVVMEPLPVAAEEKIKVHLLEPIIKHPLKYDRQKPVRLNRASNVEWDVQLAPGESKQVVLRYSIECPAENGLEFAMTPA